MQTVQMKQKVYPWPVDDVGPVAVHFFRLPAGAQGIVVVDNVVLGPAIGGVRLSSTVAVAEVARLARAMTVKNAVAGLPHGGGKSGIRAEQPLSPADRESVLRAFAQAIRHLVDYVPGPDMGTDETAMAWVHDEIGRAVGLPGALGGIPLNEIGATGYGLMVCAEALEAAAVYDGDDLELRVRVAYRPGDPPEKLLRVVDRQPGRPSSGSCSGGVIGWADQQQRYGSRSASSAAASTATRLSGESSVPASTGVGSA